MTQRNNEIIKNNNANSYEQIDLIDVFLQLWRGKITVVVSMFLVILLALVYLFFAKEKWTSIAIVSQPDAAQIATYNNALSVIYGNTVPNITDVQQRVAERFSSALSALAERLENQEKPEKLSVESSVKGQQSPLQITYVGNTAENAKDKLARYIQQVDERIGQELSLDLNNNIRLQINTLKDSLHSQEVIAEEQKALRIRQIGEALKFATEAKITSPQIRQTDGVTQDTMVLLGVEALASMVKNESTRPLVFSPAYYQTRQNLLDIQNLKINPQAIHAYRYVMKPSTPIRRDSPKRVLTLVLAALLGGIFGAGVVLGRNAILNYKQNS